MNRFIHVAAALLAGCSSYDEDVFASTTHVSLTANTADADALADVQIELELVAGWRASHTVILGGVFFQPQSDHGLLGYEPPEQTLDVILPATFDTNFDPGEARTALLINIATTNAKLTPFCSMPIWLVAEINYEDDEGQGSWSRAVAATVTCTP